MNRMGIIYQNSVVIDDWQWFWSEDYNALYKRNLTTREIQRIGGYESYKNAAYTKLVYYQQKLIALPNASDKIMIYDMEEEEFRYSSIGIPEMEETDTNPEKFYGEVVEENWVFMIGCKTAHILKFDMAAEQTVGYVDLYQKLPEKKDGIGYLREGVAYNGQILIPALYDNYIFELNSDSLQYSVRELDKAGNGFSTVCKVENEIWLFPFDGGEIIRWNIENERIIKYCITGLVDLKKESRNFLSAYFIENKLWIIPRFANKILMYDYMKNEFSNVNMVNSYFANLNRELAGISADAIGENIIFLSTMIEKIIIFNTKNDEMLMLDNKIPDDDFLDMIWEKNGKFMISEREIQLDKYIKFLCRI